MGKRNRVDELEISACEQVFWIAGVTAAKKAEFEQMHLISVDEQPVLPRALRTGASWRANNEVLATVGLTSFLTS